MIDNRRGASRRTFLIECTWTRDARITDLSATGCFVDSRVVPNVGDYVEFHAQLGRHTAVLTGTAVNVQPNIGFGVRFENLGEETVVLLVAALERAARSGG